MLGELTSPLALNVTYCVALIGLAVAVFSDHLQTLARYRGAVRQRVAGGYNLAMKVMVVNRIGAVLFFVLIAFNIDNGLSAERLSSGLALTIGLISIPTLYLLAVVRQGLRAKLPGHSLRNFSAWPKSIALAALAATGFNIMGLTLPWLAAASYPELRLTLANTSFVFNTIFTAINVFYIEHHFAKLIDAENAGIHYFVVALVVARLAAFVSMAFFLWFLL